MQADQDVLRLELRLPLMPPNLMLFPDICHQVPQDEFQRHFPIRRASVLHYTWQGEKGFQ